MKRDAAASPYTQHNALYKSKLASTSSTSVWSDAWSQHSDDSNSSGSSDSDSCESNCFSQATAASSQSSLSSSGSTSEPLNKVFKHGITQQQQLAQVEIPRELRQNPRRTSHTATTRTGCPPSLVKQDNRKHSFVDTLVDSSTHIVEAIWPTSSVVTHNERGGDAVLSLRTFIQETLRRSRTSYSTLQVALYYLILIRPHVPKHDFTMEQPGDCHSLQAIQCGRRMFLAALILASKYLQDRNYSARAWSKISGLHVLEINQNEMTFLLAVGWKLHITSETYARWCDCVNKFKPPQPPAPGLAAQRIYERQCEEFRNAILTLTPELDNLCGLDPQSPIAQDKIPHTLFPYEVAVSPKPHGTPAIMEPAPATVYTPGRFAPALGLLPTPRLTPQTAGFSTPAVNAASHLLTRGSMGFAMAQASSTTATQSLDRWPPSAGSSPQLYLTRRSSLANSVSTASSPESMVSDTSRLSRSSSISSASSAGAPSAKLDVLARCRSARQFTERTMRPVIASVPEDYEVECLTASPETYTGPVTKDFSEVPYVRQPEMDEAARALQELQRYGNQQQTAQVRAGSKRSRSSSLEDSLQENVRDMLSGRAVCGDSAWTDSMIRNRTSAAERPLQVPVRPSLASSSSSSYKRMCCSYDVVEPFHLSSLHTAFGGPGGPGMWAGILQ